MTADVLKTFKLCTPGLHHLRRKSCARFFPVSPSCAQVHAEDPGEEMDGRLRGTHTTHGEANAQENAGANELTGLTRTAKHVRNAHGYLIPGGKSAPVPAQPAPGASPKTMSNGWENTDTLAYSRFVALQHKKRRNLGPCSVPPVERTDPAARSRAWAQPGASILSVPPGEAPRLVKLLELPLSCKTPTQRGSRLIPPVPQLHPKPAPWQPGPFLGNTPMPA